MLQRISEYRLFVREFRASFHTTGAILPSGRQLSRALARWLSGPETGRRILEVGPGTGAVTSEIVKWLRPDDRLDLVELNESFVRCLERRFANDSRFHRVSAQARIIHGDIKCLADSGHSYDHIISGLPLNNFSVEQVAEIIAVLREILRPNGTLSFFEYAGIRGLKGWLSPMPERQRLQGIGTLLQEILRLHEFQRETILANVPPAYVHHLRFSASIESPTMSNTAVK